ncbi:NADPH-dependent FMN reductase [Paenisporosarcina cavernae]|uniref:NAD(P)H-dependent oxidoreductase n=1 Tax=Paenisporosarcina cavernae TaxID=2320858 RepID=A0A385YVZ9_9BACL|nr:NADPH-dependent FMN reductase [Paenisporosarcina cavernae]AYC30067.1 NAD(P)H-dependent oxidoreductase [Paenisporosarcina cavernae]
MQKVALLCGSLRKDSYNKALLEFVKANFGKEIDMFFVDYSQLPYFNEDIETPYPTEVRAMLDTLQDIDAVVMSMPEYNHSIPGAFKNALDWLSRREKPLAGKPVLLMGASTGPVGTSRGQNHLRLSLNAPGMQCLVMPGNEILVGAAKSKFENGQLTDESTIEFIGNVWKKFEKWVKIAPKWMEE